MGERLHVLIYLLLFIFLLNNKANAQGRVSFDLGGGSMHYTGELQESSVPKLSLTEPSIVVGINIHPLKVLNLKVKYIKGAVSGADSLSAGSWSNKRNLHFQSDVYALNVSTEFSLFNFQGRFRLTPYIFAGIGVFHFNPKAKLGDEWVYLQPLGTEGQFMDSQDYPKPYKLWQLNIPMGIGLSYRFTRAVGIKLEGTYNKTFTDYIDDVSGNYPDLRALSQTPNGDMAVIFSNRSGESVNDGFVRGNPKTMDGFIQLNLSVNVNVQAFLPNKVYKKPKYSTTVRRSNYSKLPKNIWTF